MQSIKRYVLFLAPKKKLIDWSNYVFPEHKEAFEDPLTHDGANVYLIPEFDSPSDAMEWLKSNYEPFFDGQLEEYCMDEELWPKDRSWKMFQEWVYISFQSCVYDMVEGPIEKKEW